MTSDGFNKYVLMNSIHLWQQCYLLGYYAVSALGKRGLMLGAVYDSGYAFYPAFDLGMRAAAENSTLDFKFLSMPGPGELSDIKSAFQQIDTSNVDFVFSLFCGEEATIFLEEYHRLGLHEQIPLLGLPFLLEPSDKKLEGVSVITTRSDFKEGEIDPSYQAIYSELGNLSGIAIGQAIIKGGGKIDVDLLGAALNEANANRVYEHDLSPRLLNEIAVIRNSFSSSNELSSECLLTKKVDLLEDKDFLQMRDAGASSWLNPYLGI
uniref:ABC transporter substrate-binding protein n=1 Tax=Roseivirga sp. TaxID=1964215 RepID=UPI004048C503